MLKIEGLCKRFGTRTILDEVSLSVAPGSHVAVIGESGSGKSTLLNLIAGLESPDAGRIELDGTDVAALGDDARTVLRRRRLGFVFQAFHVLPHLTLADNVMLPLVLLQAPPAERERRARALLDAVGLGARASAMPRELSGGELQRVALARALVHEPALVLADEPTGNLDPESAGMALDLIAGLVRRHQAAVVLVTHSATAAARADRVLRLERGRLLPA
ncbi:MAG TPA: ABC transporter ATP-binding protein [Burkholderiaceae bacterium]|nr:ABC transporter ATP-binding protein [Burkholderiaceae bacterium]